MPTTISCIMPHELLRASAKTPEHITALAGHAENEEAQDEFTHASRDVIRPARYVIAIASADDAECKKNADGAGNVT